jgi:hypothetical protein
MQSGYLGNPNLKKVSTPIEWTPELLAEYKKCAEDPIYFAEKYIKVVHVDLGLIPIALYDYQKEIILAITHNRKVVCNTSRQAGKTTTAVVIILHYILFNSHKTVALLANKGDSAREVMDRIQIAYESLPHWLQQGVVVWNKGSIEIENGCKVIAAASSSSAIRGKSVSFLYIDETAFLENWSEFYTSVYPTISSGNTTKILLTSTPNGLNHFWAICKGAQEGINGFKYIEVSWERVPGRGEEWRKETLGGLNGDTEKFNQEFCCSFIGSSNSLISGNSLKSLMHSNPIAEQENIKQYVKPAKDRIYALIADVSRGKGLDYSAFSVFDITEMPYVQVCTFRDNFTGPGDYAGIIHRVGTLYNEAFVLIEINDIGAQVSDTLFLEYGYENMLFTENAGRAGKRISSGFSSNVDRGIRTTNSVKSVGCSILKMLVEQEQIILNDFQTIQEISRFVKKGASYEAEAGHNDDLVMGLVLFSWLTQQSYFGEITDINTLSRLREKSEEELDDSMLPFGIIDDGRDQYEEHNF